MEFCLLADHQGELYVHALEDPFSTLLQSSRKVGFVVFMHYSYQSQLEFELPTFKFFFLFEENERKLQ